MLNTKKHKTLTSVIVGIVGLGLVMAYVPLLFVNKRVDYGYQNQPAPEVSQPSVTSTVTSTPNMPLTPQN